MQINSSIINEHKHITQQMIKEFTPLLGYISWSSFQWIIIINLLKVLKNVLYNAQNDQQTAPMASECPKTPSWAFSAPRLAKKRRS
jgi:hypothetical protein